MKKIFNSLIVIITAGLMSSCTILDDLGLLPDDWDEYPIEMDITWPMFGLDRTHISTTSSFWYGTHTNDFRVVENYKDDGDFFGLDRAGIHIPTDSGSEISLRFYIKLFLPGIPIEENVKYYIGDIDGRDISDGQYVPDLSLEELSLIKLDYTGPVPIKPATFGWVKFTRFELTKNSRDGDADLFHCDLEFEFEVIDPETGEITQKVENGKIFNNPGLWGSVDDEFWL